jgi:hypothetical protein
VTAGLASFRLTTEVRVCFYASFALQTTGIDSDNIRRASNLNTRGGKIKLAMFGGQAAGGEMNGWKWPNKLKIQIWVFAALVFLIWIVLQNPARWR